MKRNRKIFWFLITTVFAGTLLIGACTKIPKEGSLAPDITYRNRKQFAISGLAQNIGDFQVSSSTLPLSFEIVDVRELNGHSISALQQKIPVIRYTQPIVGNETPEELLLKTDTVMTPAVTINLHTGRLEILEGNKIPAGEYHFDIKVSNQSGSRLLKDALVIEFNETQVVSFSAGMAQTPVIERVGDTPNQIKFVGYLNGVPFAGDQIDFTENRSSGFKGTFVNDAADGEIWNVNFPVKESDTYCTWKITTSVGGVDQVSYVSENFDFVIGLPGSYIIRLYK